MYVMRYDKFCCACQVSERAIVQVFERCHELEVIDIVPARWHAAQDLLLWQTVSFAHTCANTHLLYVFYIDIYHHHTYVIVDICVFTW